MVSEPVFVRCNVSDIDWKKNLSLSDDQVEDLRFLGYSYLKQGHYETAKTFFEALVILNPESAYDFQTLGALCLQLGDNLSALDNLEKALKIEHDHAPTQLNRAKTLLLLGYKDQGRLQLEALRKHPHSNIANAAEALILSYS
jgi:tetratricopeptide (TPR) repeat protein